MMIPIVIIGIGISIIWNGYLVGNYISFRLKRKWKDRKKWFKQKADTYMGKKPNKMALTKKQQRTKARTAMAKKTVKEQQKKGIYKKKA